MAAARILSLMGASSSGDGSSVDSSELSTSVAYLHTNVYDRCLRRMVVVGSDVVPSKGTWFSVTPRIPFSFLWRTSMNNRGRSEGLRFTISSTAEWMVSASSGLNEMESLNAASPLSNACVILAARFMQYNTKVALRSFAAAARWARRCAPDAIFFNTTI